MAEVQEHVVEAGYTIDDDGVWLSCSCSWRGQVEGAEFFPTVEQLAALATEHRGQGPVLTVPDGEQPPYTDEHGDPWAFGILTGENRLLAGWRAPEDGTEGPGEFMAYCSTEALAWWLREFMPRVYEDQPPPEPAATLPEHLQGMPAKDRAVWLVVQRVHDAALTDEDPRTPAPFADLLPEAQSALIATLVPVIQVVNAVSRNPEAHRS